MAFVNTERTARVDWKLVAKEGKEAFDRFEQLVIDLGKEDTRWEVTIHPKQYSDPCNSIHINYYDTPDARTNGTGIGLIRMHAAMRTFSSAGSLTMSGNEAWEFAKSEEVGNRAGAVIIEKLKEAGLAPKPTPLNRQHGRASFWSTFWEIYPNSHPKPLRDAAS